MTSKQYYLLFIYYTVYNADKSFTVTVKNRKCGKSRVTAGRHDSPEQISAYSTVAVFCRMFTLRGLGCLGVL